MLTCCINFFSSPNTTKRPRSIEIHILVEQKQNKKTIGTLGDVLWSENSLFQDDSQRRTFNGLATTGTLRAHLHVSSPDPETLYPVFSTNESNTLPFSQPAQFSYHNEPGRVGPLTLGVTRLVLPSLGTS